MIISYSVYTHCKYHPAASAGASSIASATMFGIEEARRQKDNEQVDVNLLISEKDEALRAIALWGTYKRRVLGQTVVGAYDISNSTRGSGSYTLSIQCRS